MSETKITFLGCGTSTGVPVISCHCEVCRSDDPRDSRTRSSIFLQSPEISLLVDTGPDLRLQLLREEISHADAVLYTHGHVDHTTGLDETRAFCWRRDDRLPMYGSADTLEILARMFPWAFDPSMTYGGYVRATGIKFTEQFQLGDITIIPFEVEHASMATHGFKFILPSGKSFAYASDLKSMPVEHLPLLADCDLHILDGLRFTEHASHMTVGEACALAETLDSPRTYLTHLSHDIHYERDSPGLPPNCKFAYDGLNFLL